MGTPNMGLSDYLKSTKGEMKHVSWPTRRQVAIFTVTVIAVSLGTALFLGFFDFIFSSILKNVITPESGGFNTPALHEGNFGTVPGEGAEDEHGVQWGQPQRAKTVFIAESHARPKRPLRP